MELTTYRVKYLDETKEPEAFRLSELTAAQLRLGRRARRGHKYSFGRALILAGSVGYTGAPVLAANAAERGGAGLTQLLVPESIYRIAAARCDGAVVRPLPQTGEGSLSREALPEILERLEKADACLLGPGLGLGGDQGEIMEAVLAAARCPLVLDADALTLLGREPELLQGCRVPVVLTPHEGEFKRLGGDLSRGRLFGAWAFSRRWPGAILALKGYGTLVAQNGELSVNPTGGPALAKGGAGDVLAGLLCALLAQGFAPLFAARCAVYLHGLAGDLAERELTEYCLTPSELLAFLPQAFQTLTEEKQDA